MTEETKTDETIESEATAQETETQPEKSGERMFTLEEMKDYASARVEKRLKRERKKASTKEEPTETKEAAPKEADPAMAELLAEIRSMKLERALEKVADKAGLTERERKIYLKLATVDKVDPADLSEWLAEEMGEIPEKKPATEDTESVKKELLSESDGGAPSPNRASADHAEGDPLGWSRDKLDRLKKLKGKEYGAHIRKIVEDALDKVTVVAPKER